MITDSVQQHQLVTLNGNGTPVLARLSYQAAQPYAVSLAFQAEPGRWVEWTFARDLLTAGLEGPVGEGDVRVRPEFASAEELYAVEIESPDGYALVEIHREDVERFLTATAAVVPYGEEEDHFDVDALIRELTGV
ncbi:SsgA family sporulation/cell division regulator [Amycolatopsis suaedae]|uniref:SsgA family sporulation/cell division regulator n=1 Tax=Amycolatopsis suaedae TaxID=2510978 RepID=A0A4Q7J7Y4_9PSEU|nr:SsgA family sporulation/cell division regulator [Amycolatopsis suaedae]RZQ63791.1 SsgA family sporulation/cell division regulator [Amycolatopsis suaedae]